MEKSSRLYFYGILSLLLCIPLSWELFRQFRELNAAEYPGLSTQFGLAGTFLVVCFITGLSVFFQRDKFLKSRTIFLCIFCGVLNLSFSLVYFLITKIITDNKGLAVFLGCALLLIGVRIIRKLVKGRSKEAIDKSGL